MQLKEGINNSGKKKEITAIAVNLKWKEQRQLYPLFLYLGMDWTSPIKVEFITIRYISDPVLEHTKNRDLRGPVSFLLPSWRCRESRSVVTHGIYSGFVNVAITFNMSGHPFFPKCNVFLWLPEGSGLLALLLFAALLSAFNRPCSLT